MSLLRHDATNPDQSPVTLRSTKTWQMSLVREDGLWRVDAFDFDCLAHCP
jgi:hypothetical protein